MWYTFLGVFQMTVWEAIYMHCCATKRISYMSDEEAFSSKWGTTMFIFAAFWVPIFRELHFYFAHRFIHIKAMYKYIHSLHHRNTDIEPCAGLCMHPVEHMYYFSCIAPSLYHFAWNGWHLLLSPAASHSGWEDHMQSDQFHYTHHALFECNYGSASFPLDNLFGTFRDKLEVSEKSNSKGFIKKDIRGFNLFMAFSWISIFMLATPFLPDSIVPASFLFKA